MKNARNVVAAKGGRMESDGALHTQLFPCLLAASTMILVLSFLVYPVARVFYLSFQNYDLIQAWKDGFAGSKNYQKLSRDGKFCSSLTITAKWILTQVVGQLVLGTVMALLLNQKSKGKGFTRVVSPVPWTISDVLVTMLQTPMYDWSPGLVNSMLMRSGIISKKVTWLADSRTFFPVVNVAELQRGAPFLAINTLATLQSVSADVYESGAINGYGSAKDFFYVTLPYLKESIISATLLRDIWKFNSIDMIFTVISGGPMGKTTTLPIYMMETVTIKGNYGYGPTIGVIIFLILLVFTVFYIKASGSGGEENE